MGRHWFGRRAGLVWLLAAWLAVAVGCGPLGGGLEFTVTFKSTHDLKEGAPFVYRGIQIGKVTSVDLGDDGLVHVKVRVAKKYAERVYREARFSIEDSDKAEGGRQLVMKEGSSPQRTPMSPGDVVQGREGFFEGLGELINQLTSEAQKRIKSATRDLEKALQEFADSPEGRELKRKLQELAEDVGEMTREQLEEFRKEQLPELKRRAEEIRKKLESEEGRRKAEEFWRAFQEFVDELTE